MSSITGKFDKPVLEMEGLRELWDQTKALRSPHQNVMLDLPEDPAARKGIPLCTGLLDYFPAALAEVARLSKIGNDQHNPGQPLHWARGKSSDHPDCIARHLSQRGTRDKDGARHSTKMVWRALALLQEELEVEAGFVPESANVIAVASLGPSIAHIKNQKGSPLLVGGVPGCHNW